MIGGGKIGIGIGVDSVKDYNIYDRADTNGYYLTNQEDVDLATLFTLNSPNVIDNGDGTYDLTSVGSDPDPLIARNDVLACLTPLAAGPLDVTPRIGASTDTADWSTTVPGRVEAATSPVVATATRDDFQPTGANATINFTEFDGESVQESDYVVFFFSSSHTFNRTISASSSGWTMVEAVVPNDGYTRRGTLRAFIKKMGATPDTSLVLNGDSSGAWAMRGMVIRGYSAIDVTSVTATGANTAPDPPSITPVTADALILLAGTATGHFTADYTITAPSWDDVSLIKGDLSSDGLGTGLSLIHI